MTISPTQVPSVAYTPVGTSSTGSLTEVKKVSVVESVASSSHEITVIHPADPERPLLGEEGALAPANSEVDLNKEKPPSEIPVEQTQSIFHRIFCCCKK